MSDVGVGVGVPVQVLHHYPPASPGGSGGHQENCVVSKELAGPEEEFTVEGMEVGREN